MSQWDKFIHPKATDWEAERKRAQQELDAGEQRERQAFLSSSLVRYAANLFESIRDEVWHGGDVADSCSGVAWIYEQMGSTSNFGYSRPYKKGIGVKWHFSYTLTKHSPGGKNELRLTADQSYRKGKCELAGYFFPKNTEYSQSNRITWSSFDSFGRDFKEFCGDSFERTLGSDCRKRVTDNLVQGSS